MEEICPPHKGVRMRYSISTKIAAMILAVAGTGACGLLYTDYIARLTLTSLVDLQENAASARKGLNAATGAASTLNVVVHEALSAGSPFQAGLAKQSLPAVRLAFESVDQIDERFLDEKLSESLKSAFEKLMDTAERIIISAALGDQLNSKSIFQSEFSIQSHDFRTILRNVGDIVDYKSTNRVSNASNNLNKTRLLSLTSLFTALIIVLLLSTIWSLFGLSRPLRRLAHAMACLAAEDTSIHIPGKRRLDEIGNMARAVEVFKENALEVVRLQKERVQMSERVVAERRAEMNALANSFESEVLGIVSSVAISASQLRQSSAQMRAAANEADTRSSSVAIAAEEALVNVEAVAHSADELTAAIREIGIQVGFATSVAGNAAGQALGCGEAVAELSTRADRVEEVVDIINSMTAKINLLALNAAIEATRAGEFGRGFSVVATEVKALSSQTSLSTGEILKQIVSIQDAAQGAAATNFNISDTISQINQISYAIAAAVNEQEASTTDIAARVVDVANSAREVADCISGIHQVARDTGRVANDIHDAAVDLASQSGYLQREMESFIAKVRVG